MKLKIFFLPLVTRPKEYPPLVNFKGRFWHAGLVYQNKVYECFSRTKYSIYELTKEKKKELEKAKAVWVEATGNLNKLQSEITSGTSCGEYVARVVGLSKATGAEKVYYPEEVYNCCTDSKASLPAGRQARMTK